MKLPVAMQPNESVILIVRRHSLFMVVKLVLMALVALVPVGLGLWLVAATSGIGGAIGGVALVVAGVWILVWAILAYLVWYRHHHDLWVITNQRLLDTYKRSLFSQSLSSADLVNVQDISVQKEGLLGSVFNFGDVRCQTAGSESEFVLAGVPAPDRILTALDAARDAARFDGRGGDSQTVPESIPGPSSARAPVRDSVPRGPHNPAAPP